MSRTIVFMHDAGFSDSVGKFISPENPTNTNIDTIWPQNRLDLAAEGARRVTWTLKVLNIFGAPAGWKIEGRFLYPVASTAGPLYNAPELVPFDRNKSLSVVGGEGWAHPSIEPSTPGFPAHAGEWGVIAESGKPLPTVSRTVDLTDASHFLELRATATAADPANAGYRIALIAEVLT